MPKRIFEQCLVTLDGYDISADLRGADVLIGRRPPRDVTCLLDTYEQYVVPYVRRWAVKLDYFNNFAGTSDSNTGVNTVLKGVYQNSSTAGVELIVRPTTAIRSVSNPEWRGYVHIDGFFDALNGSVGEADRGTVRLLGVGDLTIATASTSPPEEFSSIDLSFDSTTADWSIAS